MSEMREDVRENVQKITRNARVQMRAQVQFLPWVKHDEHGNEEAYAGGELLAEILVRGRTDHKKGSDCNSNSSDSIGKNNNSNESCNNNTTTTNNRSSNSNTNNRSSVDLWPSPKGPAAKGPA